MDIKQFDLDELFLSAFQYAAIGMAIVGLQGNWLKTNDSLCKILGYTEEELTQMDFQTITHPDDLDADLRYVDQLLTGEIQTYQMEKRLYHKSGHIIWIRLSVSLIRSASGTPLYFVSQFENINKLKRTEERLQLQARTDYLTGLANRRYFTESLKFALDKANRRHAAIALLYIDLDDFKKINDTLGHQLGDQLLAIVATKLEQTVGEGGLLARIGGDEFAVIINQLNSSIPAEIMASNMLKMAKTPIKLAKRDINITFSIGIAYCKPNTTSDISTLFKQADIAMYKVKETGKNNYLLYSEMLHAEFNRRYQIEDKIRSAISQNGFDLVYQPIIDLKTGQWTALEALMRWQHPTLGKLLPHEFVPIAEESNLIIELGAWVIRNAISGIQLLAEHIPSLADIRLSVNCSMRQLMKDDFCKDVLAYTQQAQFNPKRLILEVTETAAMQNTPAVVRALHSLVGSEISVAIDDFGTGYSSLNYIRQFPVSFLKIDQTFIADYKNKDGHEIIKLVLELSRMLDLQVVAEGVETVDQDAFLRNTSCHYAQGYLYSPLMTIQQIIERKTQQSHLLKAEEVQ